MRIARNPTARAGPLAIRMDALGFRICTSFASTWPGDITSSVNRFASPLQCRYTCSSAASTSISRCPTNRPDRAYSTTSPCFSSDNCRTYSKRHTSPCRINGYILVPADAISIHPRLCKRSRSTLTVSRFGFRAVTFPRTTKVTTIITR